MVKRPDGMNAFEFSVLSGLRAAQLNRGCTPRVERSRENRGHRAARNRRTESGALGECRFTPNPSRSD